MLIPNPVHHKGLATLLLEMGISFEALVAKLLTLADSANFTAREYYRNPSDMVVKAKADTSPVTDADQAIHRQLVTGLSSLMPSVPILSEESDDEEILDRVDWRTCWLIDPLDGTKEFISRTDEFTINIALIINGEAVIGLISVPCQRVHYLGVLGQGANKFVEKESLPRQALYTRRLQRGFTPVLVASARHSPERVSHYMSQLCEAGYEVVRKNAGSALKFCLIAEGKADFYPRSAPCYEWDVAAGDALVRAAGGCVTCFNGRQLVYNVRQTLLAQPFLVWGDVNFDYVSRL